MATAATPQQPHLLRLSPEIRMMILELVFSPESGIQIITTPSTDDNRTSQSLQSAPILFFTKDGICRVDRNIRSEYSLLLTKRAISIPGGRNTMQVTDLDFSSIQSAHVYIRALSLPKPLWTVRIFLAFSTNFAQKPCVAGLRTWLDWCHAEVAGGGFHNFEYECAQIGDATQLGTNGAMKQISAVAEYMNWFESENYGNPDPQLEEILRALYVFLMFHYRLADPMWFDKWVGKPVYYPALRD